MAILLDQRTAPVADSTNDRRYRESASIAFSKRFALDHPAHLPDVVTGAGEGCEGGEQIGIPALDAVDLGEQAGIAGRIGRRLAEAFEHRAQIARELAEAGRSDIREKAGPDERGELRSDVGDGAGLSGAGHRPQGALDLRGEVEDGHGLGHDAEHSGGRVRLDGGERGGELGGAAHRPGARPSDDVVDGRRESVVEERRDRPVRIASQCELVGIAEPGQDALPRRHDAEQQEATHAESMGGRGGRLGGQDAQ